MLATKSKAADAKASNTEQEGEAAATFAVADPKGEWFAVKGTYPLIDTESGTRFDAGIPTRAARTQWVKNQLAAGALVVVDKPAEAVGKAAATPDPAVTSENPPADDSKAEMGNGMQSGVKGS